MAPWSIHPTKRYRCRGPGFLSEGDNRFGKKKERVFMCDGCGNMVTHSSQSGGTRYTRYQCEFAGSWRDSSWVDLPGPMQYHAWELQLIDATRTCTQECQAAMTGVNPEQRLARAQNWREERGRGRKRHR